LLGNEPLFPPNVLRPEDITDQEVRGFDDGEVLQCVHNVDQMLRDIEFQRVYTPSELARLKQFIEDSKKPLYPDCQKYSWLSGDLKLLQLKADHGWSNKSFKHLLDVLRDMLPEGNQIVESVYEAKKIICPPGIEVEKIHACKNSCVLFRGDYADLDVTPSFKGKTECIDHVCARIKLHTRLDIVNTKISATRIKSYYKP
jgi:hypothetical protein